MRRWVFWHVTCDGQLRRRTVRATTFFLARRAAAKALGCDPDAALFVRRPA